MKETPFEICFFIVIWPTPVVNSLLLVLANRVIVIIIIFVIVFTQEIEKKKQRSYLMIAWQVLWYMRMSEVLWFMVLRDLQYCALSV